MRTFYFVLFLIFTSNSFAQIAQPEMVLIEGGLFQMGNTESDFRDEYPRHDITLKSFYMGKYEVTAEEFARFGHTAGFVKSYSSGTEPACGINWELAVMYCNWLSSVSGLERCYDINREGKQIRITFLSKSNGYRLPTEAEWEYAARGGQKNSTYAYSGSDDARSVAWYMDNGKTLKKVGLLQPNASGIYDMSGNVKEWCWDYYEESYYKTSPKDNPVGPEHCTTRVARGGSYSGHLEMLRVTKRYFQPQDEADYTNGFRVVKNQ